MLDPLISYDFVIEELNQQRESGHDVSNAKGSLSTVDRDDTGALERILDELGEAPMLPGWGYEEPESLADILATLPAHSPLAVPDSVLDDKMLGGWLGRIAGCNLGKPLELGTVWTSDHIRSYLELAGAYPLRDYVPVLDPMPAEYELRENWEITTKGNVDGSARDDDIDYAILGVHLLERHGRNLSPEHVADAWLSLFPYLQVYTAERAAYMNLVTGVPLAEVPTTRNPYREWIGALIRGDAFGWTNPGRPRDAIELAYQDASLSHVANGIYGEMWSAALVACAFASADAAEAIGASLEHVPPQSRLAEALRDVQQLHRSGASWDDALTAIQERYGHYAWAHAVNNAAIIAAGLLWGDGDYAATIGLTVQGGWDTDSNAATAGSVSGVILGARALPPQFIDPLHDRTRSALFGFDNSRISDLASRTLVLARGGLA
jgi:ADP-ribosylglycohydrolase